jgi:hypothetical protein
LLPVIFISGTHTGILYLVWRFLVYCYTLRRGDPMPTSASFIWANIYSRYYMI